MKKMFAGASKGQDLIEFLVVGIFLLVIGSIIVTAIATPFISYNTVEEFNGQLVRYVPEKNSNALMVVKNLATGQNETFTNEDSFWMGKGNSRDYLALDEGKTYRVKVNWFRFPSYFWGQSRNILTITPIGD